MLDGWILIYLPFLLLFYNFLSEWIKKIKPHSNSCTYNIIKASLHAQNLAHKILMGLMTFVSFSVPTQDYVETDLGFGRQ